MTMNASRLAAIILILFSGFFFYIAGAYPAEAALFPRALLAGIMLLSIVLIVRSYQYNAYKANLSMNQKMQVVVCALAATVYVASMPYIGYYVASALFILFFAFILRFQNKVVPVVVAIAFPLIIYVVFEVLLNIPVPGIGS